MELGDPVGAGDWEVLLAETRSGGAEAVASMREARREDMKAI